MKLSFKFLLIAVPFFLLIGSSCKKSLKAIPEGTKVEFNAFETYSSFELEDMRGMEYADSVLQLYVADPEAFSDSVVMDSVTRILNENNVRYDYYRQIQQLVYFHKEPSITDFPEVLSIEPYNYESDEYEVELQLKNIDDWKNFLESNLQRQIVIFINDDFIFAPYIEGVNESGKIYVPLAKDQIAKILPMVNINQIDQQKRSE